MKNSNLQFEFQNDTYRLEFARKFRQRTERRKQANGDGKKVTVEVTLTSPKPATTVFLFKKLKDAATYPFWQEVTRATVGFFHKDEFTLEIGRERALRQLMPSVPKEMRPLIWKTYWDRTPDRDEQLLELAAEMRQTLATIRDSDAQEFVEKFVKRLETSI